MYNFCRYYMLFFDQKKVINYIKSKSKFFLPSFIYDQIHLVCTPKPSEGTETAVQLEGDNFPKLLEEVCALSGPDLFGETELYWRRLPQWQSNI